MIFKRGLSKTQKIVLSVSAAVVLITAIIIGVVLLGPKSQDTKVEPSEKLEKIPKPDAEDPQSVVAEEQEGEKGAQVDISQVVDDGRTGEITHGIDVSRFQGTINWKQVSESGIHFAMVRVGYRELVGGRIVADTNAKYNMQEASKYGVKVGVYFFSTAISNAEAIEEANWVADYIAKVLEIVYGDDFIIALESG